MARENEERKEKMQRKHDILMEQLLNLDFNNQEALLDWICEFQNLSDYIGVVTDQEKVLGIFAEHSYQKAFNREDRDNFARYIIGQVLSGLQGDTGAISQVVHKFHGKVEK